MCDYSLHGVKNRLAKAGEELMIHKFHTGSKGLTTPAEAKAAGKWGPREWFKFLFHTDSFIVTRRKVMACCIPPGARLRLSGISRANQREYSVDKSEVVEFIHMTEEPFKYRDAVRFQNGRVASLQLLDEGTRADVITLEVADQKPAKIRAGSAGAASYSQSAGRVMRV